ncbi:MAG: glycosyltransferase family 39 protein, partial [Solirubrobacteraceae bacterium]|nr:glycosyltransferase family 39 protein [Solirubrobacteraceae bacterium]
MSTASSTPRFGRPGGAARPVPGDDTSADQVDQADDAKDTGHATGRVRRLLAKAPPELAVLLVIAAALNLYGLGINGNANEYYSAAVHSMTQSWSAFFFGSFDSAGLMTVDKPPLALWIQALSVKAFGFNTWAFLVPQALMGVAAVALTFDLTRRRFGRAAALIAGFALATTPTAVAVFRHNNPDALLMLCSTLALWATVRAFESPHRTRWLVLAGVAVGLGFEAKMATALLVVPAIVAAWLWVRPLGLLRSVRQLAAFGASATAVGLAWPFAMWLIPASDRPWISGTNDNSIWSLIFGYNGLGRLVGQSGGPGGNTGGGPGGGGGGMGSVFGGDAGPLRLLDASLGSQGGWLLGLAIGGGLAILAASRLRRADARTGWLIAIGGTFATTAVAFSFASGIFHPYYVSALAPFTAALAGGGLATMVGRRALGTYGMPSADPIVASGVRSPMTSEVASERPASPPVAGARAGVGVGVGAVPDRLWTDDAERTAQAWFGAGDAETATTDDAATDSSVATSATTVSDDADAAFEPSALVRIIGGAALVAGAVTEGVVLGDADQFGWLSPVLLVATIAAGLALIAISSRKVRLAAVGAAAGLLLVAPAVWSAQTLGHATQGTFPTGGPESASGMGGPGGGRGGNGAGRR